MRNAIGGIGPAVLMVILVLGVCCAPAHAVATVAGNLLQNGDFESGQVAWTESSSGGFEVITDEVAPHEGDMLAWLGDYPDGLDTLHQEVDIPAAAVNASLTFWYTITTAKAGTAALDTLAVQVVDPADGSVLQTLATLTNLDATPAWTQSAQLDLVAYKGRKIRINFLATTDAAVETTGFFIDKAAAVVSLAVSDTAIPTGSVAIAGGAAVTSDQYITLTLAASDDTGIAGMQISDDGIAWVARDWSATTPWFLSSGNGQKTVSVKFQDFAGQWSPVYTASIIYQVPTDLIVDGGFWLDTEPVWFGEWSEGNYVLDGDADNGYYVSLGNVDSGWGYVYQEISLPADVSKADLRFWYHITTGEDPADPGIYDQLTISVDDPATGDVRAVLGTLSNRDATTGWELSNTYDLSAYAGQTVRIGFWGENDNSNPTTFIVDDVELLTEQIVFPTATITGVPTAPTNATTASFSVGGTGVVVFKYSLDGGAWVELPVWTPITASGLPGGIHTIAVLGMSSLGGWQTTPTTATWTVDLTPPAATIVDPPAGLTLEHNVALTIGGDGVTDYRYKLDNGDYGTEAPVDAKLTLTGLAAGTHTLSVIGRDAAGNWQAAPATATWQVTRLYLPQTGQTTCYDPSGYSTGCAGTGQDGESRKGIPWPDPRFSDNGNGTVTDNLTGLAWSRNASIMQGRDPSFDADLTAGDGKVLWQRALDYVKKLNVENYSGYNDWRLPNVVELQSLVYLGPEYANDSWLAFTFQNVRYGGRWWSSTSTTDLPSYAHFVDMGNGSVYDASKADALDARVWPVRGSSGPVAATPVSLPVTGQTKCYSSDGVEVPCAGTGQDGEHRFGTAFPAARFADNNETMADVTGLTWTKNSLSPGPAACGPGTDKSWMDALSYIACLNTNSYLGYSDWRLPNRNEMASLAGISSLRDAGFVLPEWGSFAYWTSSSNGSGYAWLAGPDRYAGTDLKSSSHHVWPVRGGDVLLLPSITSKSPANGASGVPVNAVVSVVFNKDMDPATVTTGTLAIQGVTGAVSYNAATRTAVFTPAAPLLYGTSYTASIKAGIMDTSGNALVLGSSAAVSGLAWSFTTEPQPILLAEALDTTTVTWTGGGDANWKGVSDVSFFGGSSARSGAVADSQSSELSTVVTGPADISFYWKVSSEEGWDFLKFAIDGTEEAAISGEVGWQQKTFSIPAGSHPLKWTYVKDSVFSSGADSGWVDRVIVTPTTSSTATLTVVIGGAGGQGSVNSSPSGIACTGGSCPASFPTGTTVTLMATPSATSLFGGWSGGGCGTGSSCTLTLAADTTVTALFDALQPVRVPGAVTRHYDRLSDAYAAVVDGETLAIQARALEFVESLVLGRNVFLTLAGGYDADFGSATDWTTLRGTVTVGKGSLTVDRLAIR